MGHKLTPEQMRNHLKRLAREETHFAVQDNFNSLKYWFVHRSKDRNYHLKQFIYNPASGGLALAGKSHRYGLKMLVEVLVNGYGELVRNEELLKKFLTFKPK